jgi:hypothetical protein
MVNICFKSLNVEAALANGCGHVRSGALSKDRERHVVSFCSRPSVLDGVLDLQ